MYEKSTDVLDEEIRQADDIFSFLEQNKRQLVATDAHTFLTRMIEENGLAKSEIVKACGFDQIYAYQILAGKRKGGRDKLICLALAMGLNQWQTSTLLYLSGEARLYARNRRDALLLFAIRQKLTVFVADDLLDQAGERTLCT